MLKTYRTLTSRKHTSNKAEQEASQGTINLRQELVRYLSETRGLTISVDNLLITHGAQMSIYVAAHLLSDPKTTVLVGKPNYTMANKIFEQLGVNLIEVSVDENGLNMDEVEAICTQKKIGLIYIIPHHHYPTTVTLSSERRIKLLELSKQFSFAIIEDDYDYDYHYASSPYLPLASGNHHGNVIYVGSFSKVLDPSVRIGFMVAPANFIEQATLFRKTVDVGGDSYMQDALAALIKDGELKRHLKKARKIYHQRRDFLDHLLKEKLSDYITYTLPPGGMAIWLKLNKNSEVTKLYELTRRDRLLISNINEKQNALRFGFASLNEKELTEAVEIIEKCLKLITAD
ncbi:HTH-type transcriptional regulator NorG [compost metagenome]